MDGTYREALALTCEARDYVAGQEPRDREALPPERQLQASCESLKVTARLAQVMAWLLLRRAVHAGEIDAEAAREPQHRLAGHAVCSPTSDESLYDLPHRLRDLSSRSSDLYQRIARLDRELA